MKKPVSAKTPPETRRQFRDAADEAEYLYEKMSYWLIYRCRPSHARPFAVRLKRLTMKAAVRNTILGTTILAKISECESDWDAVAFYVREEITLVKRLQRHLLSQPGHFLMKRGMYGNDRLARLYEDMAHALLKAARPREALRAIRESERVSRTNSLRFQGSAVKRRIEAELGWVQFPN